MIIPELAELADGRAVNERPRHEPQTKIGRPLGENLDRSQDVTGLRPRGSHPQVLGIRIEARGHSEGDLDLEAPGRLPDGWRG